MTTKAQKDANRRNTKRSTGPTSRKGKAASSINARKHGLTTPPEQASVLNWYKVILNDIEAAPNPFEQDERLRIAYQLAGAEARLERAHVANVQHLQNVQKHATDHAPKIITEIEQQGLSHPETLRHFLEHETDPNLREGLRTLLHMNPNREVALEKTGKRLARYRREAEGQRRQALKNWVRVNEMSDNI